MTPKLRDALVALLAALVDEPTADAHDVDPLITADDVSVPKKIFSRACNKRELPAVRLAGMWRARRSDVDAWLAKMIDTTPAPKSETELPNSPLDRALAKGRMRVMRGGK